VSKDIASILAGWEFDPEEPPVRIVRGDDGRDKIQLRIDLGLLQMDVDGRPDGERPFGCESLLDHYEALIQERQEAGKGHLKAAPFPLDSKACDALFREGVQYYHRYLSCFRLERFDLVARDTARNLRLFAFVARHAANQQDRLQFDQYRPYVTMMHARAQALEAVARADYSAALTFVDQGIAAIRVFLREYEQQDHESQCGELGFLLQWRESLERDRPLGPVERLEQQLRLAVSREQFEEAARLRDQIRRLRADPGGPPPGAGFTGPETHP
jgi:hypothetical protein